MVKKILSIVLWVITAAAIVVLFICARESYLNTPLKSINLVPASDREEAFCTRKSRSNAGIPWSAPST